MRQRHGGVGPGPLVDFTEGGFTVHDKATGMVVRQLSQHEFWKKVEPADAIEARRDPDDPWLVYDPFAKRWFAALAARYSGERRV